MSSRSSRFLIHGLRRPLDQFWATTAPQLLGFHTSVIGRTGFSLESTIGYSCIRGGTISSLAPKGSACLAVVSSVTGSMRTPSKSAAGIRFFFGASRRQYAANDNKMVVPVPSMGDSITEGSLSHWTKETGDHVAADEIVAIIDTDKVSVDIHAPVAGQLAEKHAKDGETVFVGKPLFAILPGAGGDTSSSDKRQSESPQDTSSTKPADAPAKGKHPVDLPKPPTVQESRPPPSAPTPPTPPQRPAVADRTAPRPTVTAAASTTGTKIVPMSRLRKRIAERLKHAQMTSASLTTFNECDMSSLMAMRNELNKDFASVHNLKFGVVSAFVVSAAQALRRMPEVNAYISESGQDIVYPENVDISIAVATPTGLLVPVLRNCQSKRLVDVEREISLLATKAREGKISLEELSGGTFTISNGGLFGSLFGTPILNPPQSSILGLHTIKDRPVVKGGEIVIRPIMYLALTYDHRLIDGREAVTFLNMIKNSIEDPRRLLLDI